MENTELESLKKELEILKSQLAPKRTKPKKPEDSIKEEIEELKSKIMKDREVLIKTAIKEEKEGDKIPVKVCAFELTKQINYSRILCLSSIIAIFVILIVSVFNVYVGTLITGIIIIAFGVLAFSDTRKINYYKNKYKFENPEEKVSLFKRV